MYILIYNCDICVNFLFSDLLPRLKESTSHKDISEMKARVYLNLGLVMEAQDHTNKAIEYLNKV